MRPSISQAERDTEATNAPLLEVHNLSKRFEGLTAVDDVTFDVQRGEIVGLIGPNGAGKSTLFNLISGFLAPDSGTITFEGRDISDLEPQERAQLGMTRTFQITRELVGMSVMDNMLLAGQNNPGENVVQALLHTDAVEDSEQRIQADAEQWLKELDLWQLRDEFAGNLSGGQRKLLEIGRGLMTDPNILLFDEPLAGVNPELTTRILSQLADLQAERDITFIIIEHDMEVIMSISDEIIGMHNGQIISRGTPEEVQSDEEMIAAYLGGV